MVVVVRRRVDVGVGDVDVWGDGDVGRQNECHGGQREKRKNEIERVVITAVQIKWCVKERKVSQNIP